MPEEIPDNSAWARDGAFPVPPDNVTESDADTLRRSGLFAAASGLGANSVHLCLRELQDLQEQRVRLGSNWVMPEHLMVCPLCLEAFQCLQDGVPVLGTAAEARFAALFHPETRVKSLRRAYVHWAARILKAAAAILLLAAGAAVIWSATHPASRLDSGTFVIARNNRELAGKDGLPANTLLTAQEEAGAIFGDGATARFAPGSRVVINRSLAGGATINLRQGRVDVAVPRQKPGRHFTVRTELGDVRVIGTRFRVSTESEQVKVYETGGESQARAYNARITAVSVHVESGMVAVDNRYDTVMLAAGQSAIMREGQKLIEVRSDVK